MLHEPRPVLEDICGANETRKPAVHYVFFYGPTALVGTDHLNVEVSRSYSFRHTTLGMTPLDE